MTTIYARATDQVLTGTILPKVACSNRNTVQLHVDFDASWHGYAKSAVFCTEDDPAVYEVPFSSTGNCTIPAEVLAYAGRLNIYAKGVKSASGAVKSSTPLTVRVLPGTPAVIVSDPNTSVYNSLLSAYSRSAEELAVERARIDNFAKLTAGSTTGDAELADIRVDHNGKTHTTAGEAVRAQTKKLARGRFAFAALLPSSIGNYPSISTADKTLTIDGDTLIINDRLPAGWVSLSENNGNNTVTWGDEITSSAICFYYDIANNKLVALNYNTVVDDYDYILLATLRIGHGSSDGKSWAACSCPIYVDGRLPTEVNSFGGFAAMLPPMHEGSSYPVYSTADNTFTAPYDTLIVDPRLDGGFVSLKEDIGNNSVYFGDFATSAICVYYDIAANILVAKPYNEKVNTLDYLLLCTIRKKVLTNATVTPMAWASCPVWIDDKLSTETNSFESAVASRNENVKAVNHRGFCTEAPENTLSAFKLSKKKGFEYVECDVSFTADGHAVLLHDSTVDRTSNGTGSIAGMTFEAVRALDFGSWFSEDFDGEQIPTFAEFIALCRNLGLHPYIELKEGTQEQIEGLVSTVKRYGMKGKVTWISFTAAYLGYVKAVDPAARLGFVVGAVNSSTITTIQGLQTGENEVFADCSADNANAEAAQLCADADIPLEVWTVNSEAALLALDPYVSGVTSDNLIAGQVLYSNNR